MQSSPGLYQVRRRSIATVSSFISSHDLSSSTRSARKGSALATVCGTPAARPRDALGVALGDHVGELPVVAAVEHRKEAAGVDAAAGAGIVGLARDPHPEHVDGRADVLDLKAGWRARSSGAHRRRRPGGAHLERPVGRCRAHAATRPPLFEEIDDVRLHEQVEIRVEAAHARRGSRGSPIAASCAMKSRPVRQEGEIGDGDRRIADRNRELRRLVVRPLQQLLAAGPAPPSPQRRGVDGVAAEVAQEIGVFLEHGDVDAGAGQRKPSIMPAGPPPTMQHVVVIARAGSVAAVIAGSAGLQRALEPLLGFLLISSIGLA